MTHDEFARRVERREVEAIDRARDHVDGYREWLTYIPGHVAAARIAELLLDVAPEQHGYPRTFHPFRRGGGEHVRA
jgi:hypothetical protein